MLATHEGQPYTRSQVHLQDYFDVFVISHRPLPLSVWHWQQVEVREVAADTRDDAC